MVKVLAVAILATNDIAEGWPTLQLVSMMHKCTVLLENQIPFPHCVM